MTQNPSQYKCRLSKSNYLSSCTQIIDTFLLVFWVITSLFFSAIALLSPSKNKSL
jgi:hypothetical protein